MANMLKLETKFDLRIDVVDDVLSKEPSAGRVETGRPGGFSWMISACRDSTMLPDAPVYWSCGWTGCL